jgi:tetratricopeptide (TPR) repeat protein
MKRLTLLLPLLLPPYPIAAAEPIDARREYRACLQMARQKPEDGWEQAIAWQSLGGGEPARHCAAVALLGLGKFEEAARRLGALAETSHSAGPLRAEMLDQAAQAWLLAGKPDKAVTELEAGLRLVPGHPELLLDKAVALAQAGRHALVVETLTALLKAQPNRVEAMVLRGSAYRILDKLELAKDDIARALVLDPDLPDALLERGLIRRLEDNQSGAREDWMRAITLMPEGAVADTARRNLELMDVKVK